MCVIEFASYRPLLRDLIPKPVQAPSPLIPDHRALHGLQHRERERSGEADPDGDLPFVGHVERRVHLVHRRHEDVAEQEDDDVGREVVGLVVVPCHAAFRAVVHGFQEAAEQLRLAAGRAFAGKRARQEVPEAPVCVFSSFNGHQAAFAPLRSFASFFSSMSRFSLERWSTKRMPSRWSISCCRHVASRPPNSSSCALPS